MPTIAHNLETAQALYRSSLAGALVEVNKQGQIQTASFGTRVRDAVIHLFKGQDARMDFRAAKAQQVAAKFMEMVNTSRANLGPTDTINGRNITVAIDDPVYENLADRFAQSASHGRPTTTNSLAFENPTYVSTVESHYEMSDSAQHSAFEASTNMGTPESHYEMQESNETDFVASEIPVAVAGLIREYASSEDLAHEVLAQVRPLMAFKVGDQVVPVGIGSNGEVYRHHLDHTAPASAKEAMEWVNKQLHQKTCDVQGLQEFDSAVVDRLLLKLGITAQFKLSATSKLDRLSVLESIPQNLKDRFAAEIGDAMAAKAQIRPKVVAADSSVLYNSLNSSQRGSLIHRQIAANPDLSMDAKELAVVLFDDMLARTIQTLDRSNGLLKLSDRDVKNLANQAIAQASQQFPDNV
jgi:hypothetical protein